jgi:hypothetical protein
MREGWLQRVEAIVERQQRMSPESDDDRLLPRWKKDCRLGFLGARRTIGDDLALLPLRDSLLVDPVALGECS